MNSRERLYKAILYRSFYRGTKEIDLILRKFVTKFLYELDDSLLEEFSLLLNSSDDVLYDFLILQNSKHHFSEQLIKKFNLLNNQTYN